MGLERVSAVLQHVHSNYEIDLFQHLIRRASQLTGTGDLDAKALRVIADHIRACSFLIVDGVLPSNEGRGYVLRRIIRRAIRYIWKLGALKPEGLFWRMVEPLCDMMGEAYPELVAKRSFVEQSLKAEEAAFAQTLDAGMQRLDAALAAGGGRLDGEQLFQLHDTYGCPPDLVIDVLREKEGAQLAPDATAQYERLMEQQRERARGASKFGGAAGLPAELVASLKPTAFLGYDTLDEDGCEVVAILREGKPVQAAGAGDEVVVLLDRTPFYAESGGQVGDTGELGGANGLRIAVRDTVKLSAIFHGHVGRVDAGGIKVGDRVRAQVDGARRQAIVLNHSATHLLHAALRRVLGEHVTQKGSLVAPDRLRFDFSHFKPISHDELQRIEAMVNAEIRKNPGAEIRHMGMEEALAFGAMALFGEKYGENVRVLRFGDFSTELCGGTHVHRTGDIGVFKIIHEGGIAAGVRRIEAVTGEGALAWFAEQQRRLDEVSELVGGKGEEALEKLRQLLLRQRQLERELESFKSKATSGATAALADQARDIGGVKVVSARLEGLDAKALRDALDMLKERFADAVVLLASAADGKAALVAGVKGSALGKVKAGELLSHVATQIGGKGGGRPDMAQGGGPDGPALASALAGVPDWVAQRLG
jgi:alanyl-tRNA synthetase